jgi:hypothetical protein
MYEEDSEEPFPKWWALYNIGRKSEKPPCKLKDIFISFGANIEDISLGRMFEEF